MSNRLHAHVSTSSRDCDGSYSNAYVETFNGAEVAESGQAVNDFSEIHFMNRVFTNHASPFAVQFGMTVEVDENSFSAHEATEEGYRHAQVVWCRDDCNTEEREYHDYRAEEMGY